MKKVVTRCLFVSIGFFVALLLAPFSVVYACGGSQGGYGGDCVTPPVIPPTVITQSAFGITLDSAILKADINPEELNTAAWFEWGASGESLNRVTPDQFIGNGISFISIIAPINNLISNTVYTFRAAAENSDGVSYGSTLSFRTLKLPDVIVDNEVCQIPAVSTLTASFVNRDSVNLRGSVNPRGRFTNAWFEWGRTPALGQETGFQSVGSGNINTEIVRFLSQLDSNTTYYFRAAAENNCGRNRGSVSSFSTEAGINNILPQVITLPATNVTQVSATMRGQVNPNSTSVRAWFEWGTNPSLTSFQTTSPLNIGQGNVFTDISANPGLLSPNTIYYYRAVADNNFGTNRGAIVSFTTLPSVSSVVAVSRTVSTASFTSVSNNSSKVVKTDQCGVSVADNSKVVKTDECGVPIAETEKTDEVNTAAVGSYFSGGALLWLLLLSFLIVFLLVYVFYTRYKVNKLLKV